VDDEPLVSSSIAALLQREGYRVGTASNVARAVELVEKADAERDPVQVVLTDLQMPGGTGLDLVRAPRRPPGCRRRRPHRLRHHRVRGRGHP